ncbi:DNA primase [Halobellus sp. GM3]|uniref:DNA primase n=1 Tax=Halobellus sp. GM3 TaxID=3458410 RepID=UPI00403DF87F
MDPLYARYPFFEGAREAVREADISPAALIAEDAPAVERGTERVERALMEGTVVAEEPRRWDDRTELLSYPIARILVSLIDTPAAVDKYAAAEASTARERFRTDFEADGDVPEAGQRRATRETVLREFGLDETVRPERTGPSSVGVESGGTGGGGAGAAAGGRRAQARYWIELGAYLDTADPDWGERWRLVNREVASGAVSVTDDELTRIVEAAVHRRVAAGLPIEVRGSDGGDAIADALEPSVSALRSLLNDHDVASESRVEAVVPALFPPCLKTLVQRARSGESLPDHSEFSLVSFLVALGMDAADVTTLLDSGGEQSDRLETRVEYLADGDGTQYPPPSCSTMKAYGDCVDPDERCETISHPLSYYTDAVRDAGDVRDWRETADAE